MAEEVDNSNSDVLVKFMHPNGPSRSYFWPGKHDICWAPKQYVLCTIDVPTLAIARGQYHLPEESEHKTNKQWHTYFYVKS